jgi:hypothetical protein
MEGSVYHRFYHKLNQRYHYVKQDQKLSGDRYVIIVFTEDRMAVRVTNIDINNKLKYYGVLINE